jgi:hypothetical protein
MASTSSHADLVVAMHAHVLAQFAEILDEVVGEGVVVVDHQEHGAVILRRFRLFAGAMGEWNPRIFVQIARG